MNAFTEKIKQRWEEDEGKSFCWTKREGQTLGERKERAGGEREVELREGKVGGGREGDGGRNEREVEEG